MRLRFADKSLFRDHVKNEPYPWLSPQKQDATNTVVIIRYLKDIRIESTYTSWKTKHMCLEISRKYKLLM